MKGWLKLKLSDGQTDYTFKAKEADIPEWC